MLVRNLRAGKLLDVGWKPNGGTLSISTPRPHHHCSDALPALQPSPVVVSPLAAEQAVKP